MKYQLIMILTLTILSVASAGETLFTSGPQEFAGRKYYWLAEWKLEVMLPDNTTSDDRFEVLFGSKGAGKRTLYFEYDGKASSMSHVGREGYAWVQIRLGKLYGGKKVTLYGKGRGQVAFLAGVRIKGKSTSAPKVKPIRTAAAPPPGQHSAHWADLPGFELTDEARRLWNPSPGQPDWRRAERSARYAGIALSKVQRWLHEQCLSVHDKRSGLFRPTGREWNYRDTAADCYPFYVWAAYYTDKEILDTVMLDTLKAEQRLCNHLDRLPVRYDMDTEQKIVTPFDTMIFGASEYAKDGLIPIVEITTLLVDHSDADRLWGLHKLEANTVRTVLIHTMLHTRNTIARPWRQGLQLGAAPCSDGICIFMKSDSPYEGLLQFDIPRHRLYMGFEQDWPRMNAVPEWFTVEPDESHWYRVEDIDAGWAKVVSGKSLSEGLPMSIESDKPLRLTVTRR